MSPVYRLRMPDSAMVVRRTVMVDVRDDPDTNCTVCIRLRLRVSEAKFASQDKERTLSSGPRDAYSMQPLKKAFNDSGYIVYAWKHTGCSHSLLYETLGSVTDQHHGCLMLTSEPAKIMRRDLHI